MKVISNGKGEFRIKKDDRSMLTDQHGSIKIFPSFEKANAEIFAQDEHSSNEWNEVEQLNG
jgi:hypothetical protein